MHAHDPIIGNYVGIRMGLSAPMADGHTLDLAVPPNELRNVRGAGIGVQ